MSAPSASSRLQNSGLSSRKRPCAAMCAESAPSSARATLATVASLAGERERVAGGAARSVSISSVAAGSRGPATSTCARPAAAAAPCAARCQSRSDGATASGRSASEGSIDHGSACSSPVGTSTSGRSLDVRRAARAAARRAARATVAHDVGHRVRRPRSGPRRREAAQAEPQRRDLLLDLRLRAEPVQPRPAVDDASPRAARRRARRTPPAPARRARSERDEPVVHPSTARGLARRGRAGRGGGPSARARPGGGPARRRGGPRAATRRARR